MAKKSLDSIRIPSARSEQQTATRKMLSLVRDELKSDIRALEQRMGARFDRIEGNLSEMRGDLSELRSGYSRMELLLEEQNSNNRIVLEGLQALWQRQDRIESRGR
jgi:hypothetical protein